MAEEPVTAPGHLDPETVEQYFRLGVPTAFRLSENPRAQLEIDPAKQELRLICPVIGAEPDVAAYERLSCSRIRFAGAGERYRFTVDAIDMHYEAYVLIESIVDELRNGASFRHAVSESLSGLKDLLSNRTKLTDEKVVGLIGELLVLKHVIEVQGEHAAVEAWLGPLAEEHDFGFEHFDAEVKTTRSEARSHRIGSDTQLEPVPGRPLYLLSVQVTRAGHAKEAFTLADLIRDTRLMLDGRLDAFDKAVRDLGWQEVDADLYRVRYQARSVPRAYLVDEEFPAITTERLAAVVPQRVLVCGVSYRVDVTHLSHSLAPAPLDNLCEAPNE
ncbi:PD-(D/E)XK motif protein [Cryobacterium sp. TMT1-66-1]|uniref:PD-(D/E)XK motif protein n=1 Tax=Cryobacterium sp. TMT1-66-1 TaxID=1259242 RepID=UPI001069A180|nr:PD-(D/E)XK motif protein [Cryobacterium sp. TMT1-66-1]TFD05532.1 PD-(D/E)XK motif protein [Cryobacterium sp. TMT1-66-1]